MCTAEITNALTADKCKSMHLWLSFICYVSTETQWINSSTNKDKCTDGGSWENAAYELPAPIFLPEACSIRDDRCGLAFLGSALS